MIAVIQRVKSAQVVVNDHVVAKIGPGILTLLAVLKGDTRPIAEKLIEKILNLRIFEDSQGKMNISCLDAGGEHLIVSQFTLAGNCNQGRRPSFERAEVPQTAKEIYEKALEYSRSLGVVTVGGQFAAHMEVSLVNDGPVTLIIDTAHAALKNEQWIIR